MASRSRQQLLGAEWHHDGDVLGHYHPADAGHGHIAKPEHGHTDHGRQVGVVAQQERRSFGAERPGRDHVKQRGAYVGEGHG